MKYLDKQTGKILEFNKEDIEIIQERKLTKRYVPYKDETTEDEIKPGNITKPQIIPAKKNKGEQSNTNL